MADNAIAVAKNLNNPFSLALSLYFASATAQVLGDTARAAEHAASSRQLATEHDLAMPRVWSAGILGWCAAENGERHVGAQVRGPFYVIVERVGEVAFGRNHVAGKLLAPARLVTGVRLA